MTNSDRGSEIGRRLADVVKKARPHAERLADTAKPRVEKVSQDALKLARDHEGELKQVARTLIRSRMIGPLGLVVDAVTPAVEPNPQASLRCMACQEANSDSAKFCDQCGARLTSG